MRIPLDYYRILGIPTQVTDEQLSQAYRDRSLQLPRSEYTEAAIAARQHLLDRAYGILGDSQQRAQYDQQLEAAYPQEVSLPETGEAPESASPHPTPWLEIAPEELMAALLILQELGEYQLVIALGKPTLKSLKSEPGETAPTARADLVLSLALAHLELSREYWQQGKYEEAAESGKQGLDLLVQEALFPGLQAEITSELYKLRPYRILGLLALREDQVGQRKKGLQLLQEMLQERQGIDGKGNDRSGLSIDDFLRFIQQLRIYLTTKEQEELFAAEAKRPSAVATYLTVYALIARGFAQKQPAAIAQAKNLLKELAKRQDVYLEEALCCLLLGQTDAASLALGRSQDKDALAFIKEQSQAEPDLLPGLCLYGERWLTEEVFSHFRDLSQQKASLEEYFADSSVQVYLEKLATEPEASALKEKQLVGAFMGKPLPSQERASASHSLPSSSRGVGSTRRKRTNLPSDTPSPLTLGALSLKQEMPAPSKSSRRRSSGSTAYQQSSGKLTSRSPQRGTISPTRPLEADKPRIAHPRKRSKRKLAVNPQRLFLAISLLVLGVAAVAWLFNSVRKGDSSVPGLEEEQLSIQLIRPPVEIPAAEAQTVLPEGKLTPEGAQQVLETWLAIKSEAFGDQHQVERLNGILTETLLSDMRDRAEQLKASQKYRRYQHQLQVRSLQISSSNPNRATVEAQVKERTSYYEKGKLSKSEDDDLRLQYDLIRQGDRWLIQGINQK